MSPPQTSNDMSSIWVKLQFFARIRRFLHSKTGRKTCRSTVSDQLDTSKSVHTDISSGRVIGDQVLVMGRERDDEAVVLQRSVKRLLFGSLEEKEMAAEEIERLARDDVKTRKLMAELGVVPPLVEMLATEAAGRRRAAVKALAQIANGTFTNKALMVEAGIFSKLPNNIANVDEATIHGLAELLLSLSTLAKTQFPIASSEMVPLIISILESTSASLATKECCLACLTNLAGVLENAVPLVSNGAVDVLLKLLSSSKQLSETALAALGLLVVTLTGKKAMECSSMVPSSLIEVLKWEGMPKCQELSAYVLMILAHQSSAQRDKMARYGIVPVLLEVALLGTRLTQKRALKLLQWFKDERQTRMGPHSGPQARQNMVMGSPESKAQMGANKMRSLVQQSLHKNMEMITKRANGGSGYYCISEGESSMPKSLSLVLSTSSKSLPY